MTKMKLLAKYLIISLIIYVIMPNIINVNAKTESNTSEIVMELNSKRVLYESNSKIKRPMASTTKILTAITVIENYDVNAKVKIKKQWTGIEGSSIYLKENELFTVKELLYGLMLRSGNDCAVALANVVGGSVERFAVLMNKTANKIGACDSNFVNPHGLHDDNHFTTARDLALITCYALKNDIFAKIVNTKSVIIGSGESVRHLKNKNKLLFKDGSYTGVKTGYTKKAGRCLVSSKKVGNFNLVCVVLNCVPMFERSEQLFNQACNEYEYKTILKKGDYLGSIAVKKVKIPCFVKQDLCYPLKKDEVKNITYCVQFNKISKLPVNSKNSLGDLKIYLSNNLIFCEKIYTII